MILQMVIFQIFLGEHPETQMVSKIGYCFQIGQWKGVCFQPLVEKGTTLEPRYNTVFYNTNFVTTQ